jgi:hypothetical protein
MQYASPADLNETHKAQIARLNSFLKGKRDKVIADNERDKEDFKSDHNSDDARVWNKAEMDQMLDYFHFQTMGKVRENLEHTAQLSGAYNALFLGQAEQYGITLQVEDITVVEDRGRLDQISSIATIAGAPPPVPKMKPQLAAISAEPTTDPRVLQELADVKAEKQQMEDRYVGMQADMTNLLQERSALAAEMEKMKANFNQMVIEMQAVSPDTVNNSASAHEMNRLLDETKGSLDMKNAECENMRKEMNARLGDSSQFRDLKSIVKKKSDEVKSLKALLTQYGISVPEPPGGCVELQADSD